jgi:uncharacterized protein involved in type VI secretion and phage assembly
MNANGGWDESRKYYGKYRGTVDDNVDPQMRGRLRLLVPDVLGKERSTWALPCVPVAGRGNGFYALPVKGSMVWVEFEQGDSDHPIWVGCSWGEGELPPLALQTPPRTAAITLQTERQHGLTLSDAPGPAGGIVLKSAGGAMLTVNDSGITLDNGQGATITLKGATVSINGNALEVT